MSATLSFYLKLGDSEAAGLEPVGAASFPTVHGLDALPAPGVSRHAPEPPAMLHDFLDRARSAYDWILLDLPAVFHRASLLALPEADRAFLVTTAELPSLHLTRKAVSFLAQLGFGADRVRVLVNRVERKSGLTPADMEKILERSGLPLVPERLFLTGPRAGRRAAARLRAASWRDEIARIRPSGWRSRRLTNGKCRAGRRLSRSAAAMQGLETYADHLPIQIAAAHLGSAPAAERHALEDRAQSPSTRS